MVNQQPVILTVNYNQFNLDLLNQFLEKAGYKTIGARTLDEFDHILADKNEIKLSLIDITGYDKTIWDRCKQLHERGIPSLIISPRQSHEITKDGHIYGAKGILVKPLAMRDLLGMIHSLLEE